MKEDTGSRKVQIGVMGSAADLNYARDLEMLAEQLGAEVAKNGAVLMFGAEKDYDSLSTAACRGAKKAGGTTVGVTYGKGLEIFEQQNVDLVIASASERGGGRETVLVSSCDALIALNGGSGTLTEIAIAYQANIPIVVLKNTGGWSEKLGGTFIDARERIKVEVAESPQEAVQLAIRLSQAIKQGRAALAKHISERESGYDRARETLTAAIKTKEKLRIAIQKDGRLAEIALKLLEEAMNAAGISSRKILEAIRDKKDRRLIYTPDEALNVKIILLRNGNIAEAVARREVDYGITGEEKVLEKTFEGGQIQTVARLGLAKSSLVIAAPEDSEEITQLSDLHERVVATSLPNTLRDFLERQGIYCADYRVLDGSVEAAPELGMAEAIADLTETGNTMRANGLTPLATVRDFEAVLIAPLITQASSRVPTTEI